jgi:IPT/TIG domain
MRRIAAAAVLVSALAASAAGATFEVTSNADSGAGTLRQAILDANAGGVTALITFHVGGGGQQWITLASALPPVTVPVTLDGTTQPGYVNTPLVTLQRNDAADEDLLVLASGSSSAVALAFVTDSRAVVLTSPDNVVSRCAFTAPTGVEVRNAPRNQILTNIIAGKTGNALKIAGANTLVSSNTIDEATCSCADPKCAGPAVLIEGDANRVVANRILASSQSDVAGVSISGNNNVFGAPGAGNRVSGFGGSLAAPHAVEIHGGGNAIGANTISTNKPFACYAPTVALFIDGDNNTIGGAANTRNVIGGNSGIGVSINGAHNTVSYNYLGLDATGTRVAANLGGVAVAGSSNQIGPANVIAGNGTYGVLLAAGSGNRVTGNTLGATADGAQQPGNGEESILVHGASGNAIGGTAPGEANAIYANPIVIDGGDSNPIRRNRLCNATIELAGGGNRAQKAPVLESAIAGATSTSVHGSINGLAGKLYTIELFNAACGGAYLGSINALTDAGGHASFFVNAGAIPAGTQVWATATSERDDTSELSAAIVVTAAGAPRIDRVTPDNGLPGGQTVVTIAGAGFQAGASVTFGGVEATAVTVIDASTIIATTPAHAAGAVDVTVRNADGQSSTLPAAFRYVSCNVVPAIIASPGPLVPSGGTATLTIDSSGLTVLSVQWIRVLPDKTTQSVGDPSAVFITPPLLEDATFYAIVLTPCGQFETAPVTIRVSAPPRRRAAPHV